MTNNGKPKAEKAKCLETIQYSIPDDVEALEAFPTLFDLLTPRWKEGVMTREEGRMSIAPDGSMWRLTITCPTEKVQCSIWCNKLTLLLETAEEIITSGKVNWVQTWTARKKGLQKLDDLL